MEPKRKINKRSVALIASLLLAALVFVILLLLSDVMAENRDEMTAIVAVRDIPAGTVVEEAGASQYFATKSIPKDLAYEGTFRNMKELFSQGTIYVTSALVEYEIVSEQAIAQGDCLTKNFTDPVSMGIKVGSFSKANGGILRRGDLVELCTWEEDGSENSLRAYILQAFDSAGSRIEGSDTESVASAFNILIERDDYATVAGIMAAGYDFDLIKINDVY